MKMSNNTLPILARTRTLVLGRVNRHILDLTMRFLIPIIPLGAAMEDCRASLRTMLT